jgi:hypothetical protein
LSEVSPLFPMESFSESVVSLSLELALLMVSSSEETSSSHEKSSDDEEDESPSSSLSLQLVLCFFDVAVDSSASSSSW